MLVLTRKLGDTVRIGHDITVTSLRIRGQVMKIGIDAPSSIRVLRGELCDEVGRPCDLSQPRDATRHS